MKILNKALELLGLIAIAIGITIGVAEAQSDDISDNNLVDVPVSSDVITSSDLGVDSGGFIPTNLMVDPVIGNGGAE